MQSVANKTNEITEPVDEVVVEPLAPSLSFTDPIYGEVHDWYVREAALLDQGQFDPWLGMLHEDLEYTAPVRVTRTRCDGPGFTTHMHMDETYNSLAGRIRRLGTGAAWGEDPPSRTRRFVSNITVNQDRGDPGVVHVSSYLLITRSRWDSPTYQLIAGERRDTLQLQTGPARRYKLLRREILMDQSNLGTVNMALFL